MFLSTVIFTLFISQLTNMHFGAEIQSYEYEDKVTEYEDIIGGAKIQSSEYEDKVTEYEDIIGGAEIQSYEYGDNIGGSGIQSYEYEDNIGGAGIQTFEYEDQQTEYEDNIGGAGIQAVEYEDQLIEYEELVNIGGSCKPLDTCDEERWANTADSVPNENYCTCNSICSRFGICCMDADDREKNTYTPNTMPICRWMEGKPGLGYTGFYMVDRCSTGDEFESVWKDPCETDSVDDDLLSLAPVTSLLTSMTYKNYFCFRCYEKTSDFAYWNLVMSGQYDGSENITEDFANGDYDYRYNQQDETWIAVIGRDSNSVPVKMRFEIPERIRSLGIECNPYMIYTCSESWTDDEIRKKCHKYQASVWILGANGTLSTYRNAYCALCNNESLENKLCYNPLSMLPPRKDQYDFSHTIDVNRYDGNILVPVEPLCEDVWDPYGKGCRKISCPNPDNEVKDDMCMPSVNSYDQPFYGL